MNIDFSQYKSKFWTINYPSNWSVEEHQSGVSFFAEDGIGALQISAYAKATKVISEDLEELIQNEIPQNTNLSDIEVGDFAGLSAEFKHKNHCWRVWVLTKENVMLYVTYNCDFEVCNVEREIINQIIDSLKLPG